MRQIGGKFNDRNQRRISASLNCSGAARILVLIGLQHFFSLIQGQEICTEYQVTSYCKIMV